MARATGRAIGMVRCQTSYSVGLASRTFANIRANIWRSCLLSGPNDAVMTSDMIFCPSTRRDRPDGVSRWMVARPGPGRRSIQPAANNRVSNEPNA